LVVGGGALAGAEIGFAFSFLVSAVASARMRNGARTARKPLVG
jgi:hypothetical protein